MIEKLRGQIRLPPAAGCQLGDMQLGECFGGKKKKPSTANLQRAPLTGCSILSQYETGNKKSVRYIGERHGELLHMRGMLTN